MEKGKKRTILITGGTSGLGLELVRLFARRGCMVLATGRNMDENNLPSGDFSFIEADFSNLKNTAEAVRKIRKNYPFPDIIINNAGILSPPQFKMSEDGFELSFQVNFLSHLLINEFLVSEMTREKLLIISVTSPIYRLVSPDFEIPGERGYKAFKAYAESKYYMLLIGDYLKSRYPGRQVEFIGFNPGTFSSGIYRMQKDYFHKLYHVAAPFMKRAERVANVLADIIDDKNLRPGRLYRSPGQSADIRNLRPEEAEKFLDYCIKTVLNFLKP